MSVNKNLPSHFYDVYEQANKAIYACIMILNAGALKSEDITRGYHASDVKPGACQTIPHADSEPLDTVNDVESACQETMSCVYSGSPTVLVGKLKCDVNKEEMYGLLKTFGRSAR